MRQLKIGVATAGRFWLLDLARELHALGHEVKFYSYVPLARARRFGLPDECHVSVLPFVLPALAWERLAHQLLPRARERFFYSALNRAVTLRLRPCEVFICMSGIYLEAALYAKHCFGARIWLQRGSRHILSQDEILAEIPGAQRPSPLAIRRELAGYALADRVVVPSAHVEESFRRDCAAHSKLFYSPLGVDLSMFPLRIREPRVDRFSCLFVGTWSLRKGCDILVEAMNQVSGVRLIHVGAIADFGFPTGDSRFIHVDPVPQFELAAFYAAANVFVLASREEGFGMVLAQALASGLPLICTDRTGGADLAYTPSLATRITVVPSGDVVALALAIAASRDQRGIAERLPLLSEADREMLSWAAYARRHSDELIRECA